MDSWHHRAGCKEATQQRMLVAGPGQPASRAFWDRRYETAWRMGAWAEMAEVQPDVADGAAGPPFNQTICVCLKAGHAA